ncbi:MAG: tetratricopeptide repeat protein [Candidatus Aegiribacteria sp.]|nr:tetratricopeptide repeat protein [Candidatus Aegiribacteria sp.]
MAGNDYSKEIEKLDNEWVKHPTPTVCARLADLLRQRGRLDESLEMAEIGLRRWNGNISISIVQGKCFRDSGLLEKALDIFSNAHDAQPQNLVALLNLAQIHFQKKQWNKAVEYLEEYLFEHPGDEEARELLEDAKIKKNSSKNFYDDDESSDESDPDTSVFPETERMTKVLKSQGIVSDSDVVSEEEVPEAPSGDEPDIQISSTGSLLGFFSEEEKDEFQLKSYDKEVE